MVVQRGVTLIDRAVKEVDLGEGSSISCLPGHFSDELAGAWFRTLQKDLPWQRPEISVRGRKTLQPRETFYIADPGLKPLKYSGYQPAYHTWDQFPLLEVIRREICKAVPGQAFNSCLINRYEDGESSVAWHSDNEKLFGIAPTIASLSLGRTRDFLIRKKVKKGNGLTSVSSDKVSRKRSLTSGADFDLPEEATDESRKFRFDLANGDVLVMRGNMQRDWDHSVPRRKAVKGTRLSLTFRTVVERDVG